MHKTFLFAALLGTAVPAMTWADTLTMPADAPAASAEPAPMASTGQPQRGESMKAVIKQFGQPRDKHPAVGGGKPRQPPITRWDYDGFTVVFERSKVVDVVIPNAPLPVAPQKVDELQPAPPPAP